MSSRDKQMDGGPTQPRPPHLPIGGAPTRPMGGHGANVMPLGAPRLPHQSSSNGGGPQHRGPSDGQSTGYQQQARQQEARPSYAGSDSGSNSDGDKGLKMKIKRTKSGRQEIVKGPGEMGGHSNGSVCDIEQVRPSGVTIPVVGGVRPQPHPEMNGRTSPPVTSNGQSRSMGVGLPSSGQQLGQLTSRKLKVDAGTLTDSSTLTEPEILGPCEPGTSVNLEGIVWHETDTGVLVVNVTWRGKTYVGTLLDCTRHTNQWSAPRFTDSPEPGGKGRGKRGRSAAATPCEIEPRKNLRSSKAKGKGKNNKTAVKEEEFNFPAPSSPATKGAVDTSGKRKGGPNDTESGDEGKKRKRTGSENEDQDGESGSCPEGGEEPASPPPPPAAPRTKDPKPVVYSYKLLDCPRKDCSKQYKQEEGLKWHLSHSHPEYIDPVTGEIKDAAQVEKEEQERKRRARSIKEERRKEIIKTEPVIKTEKDVKPTPHGLNLSGPIAKIPKLEQEKGGVNRASGSPKPNIPMKPAVACPPPPSPGSPVLPTRGGVPQAATGIPLIRPPGNHPLRPIVPAQAPRQPGQLPPGLIAPNLKPTQSRPTSLGEPMLNLPLEDLKKKRESLEPSIMDSSPTITPSFLASTPSSSIVSTPCSSPGVTSEMAGLICLEKPPANSPAYSDISDDGDDSRGSKAGDMKSVPLPPFTSHSQMSNPPAVVPTMGHGGPAVQIIGSVPAPNNPITSEAVRASLPPPPNLVRSSPIPRTETVQRVSTPSAISRPNSRPSPATYHTSQSIGPSPGTPEYHKYLAANGFPPFPYPSPVGMDPNYHLQLLKTDAVYKSKWEKDRAEREKAFKEQLDRDQGKYSGLSMLKEDKLSGSSLPSTPIRKQSDGGGGVRQPEDLRKREPSGERGRSMQSPMGISVKAEFREKEEPGTVKREVKPEPDQGMKPTMETRGPPQGPQTFGYMHPALVRPPYSMGGLPPPFDPLMSSLSPYGLPGMPQGLPQGLPGHPGSSPHPYLSPAHLASIRPPAPFGFPGDHLRSPFPGLGPSPEDLARAGLPSGPPGLSGTKALDLLQQHASQYYANQKLAELQERALKSPSNCISSATSLAPSPTLAKPITTFAGKESPTPTTSSSTIDKSKSPPPLRHVHTHTHTHIGLGYPLLPPGAMPPVPGAPLAPPPGAGLPPTPVGVAPPGMPPFSGANSYPGKSPT